VLYKLAFVELRKYLILSILLTLINTGFCFYRNVSILRDVLSVQLFLFVLFLGLSICSKALLRLFPNFNISITLGSLIVKMLFALLYLLPVLIGNKTEAEKEVIALFFMINYLLYLSYSVYGVVKHR
jgi:hypothetical protein